MGCPHLANGSNGSNGEQVITAEPIRGCPMHLIPKNLQIQSVDHKFTESLPTNGMVPSSTPATTYETIDILTTLQGHYHGPGFNTIFRPRNEHSYDHQVPPNNDGNKKNDILQLNLTQEHWVFSSLGAAGVPNRGLHKQTDIHLHGVSYVQKVDDVGTPDGHRSQVPTEDSIHFETGLIMVIPPTFENPKIKETTISRMASIPHGTTINLQGPAPTTDPSVFFQQAPDISPVWIDPFTIGCEALHLKDKPNFTSQIAKNRGTARIPENLDPFIAAGTITQDYLTNPNQVLRDANDKMNIIQSLVFTLDSDPMAGQQGGGTTNISFLQGTPRPNRKFNVPPNPNADVPQVTVKFWFNTVVYEVELTPFEPVNKDDYKEFRPVGVSPDAFEDGTFPVFRVEDKITEAKNIKVNVTAIQYSQTVILDFANLSWPHVSVATLLPVRSLIPSQYL